MSDDLVERLRLIAAWHKPGGPTPKEEMPSRNRTCCEAADHIEALEARLAARADERAVMVCPQCEGEGSYADGLDEAACSTDCTRCGTNGWIVNLAALQPHIEAQREDAARMALEAAARLVAPTMNKRGPFAMVVSHAIAAIDPAQFRRPA